MHHTLQNISITNDDKAWEVEIRAEIPPATIERFRTETIKDIQKTARVDGFRAGHVPTAKIIDLYGEDAILTQTVEHAIQHELPELLAAEKLLIIASPRVTTTPPEQGKPVSFTARAPRSPVITLPDYRTLAMQQAREEVTVSDADHADTLTHIRRERARIEKIEAGIDPTQALEEARSADTKDLPELDDAFVQSLGYNTTETFTDAVRANIRAEKNMQAEEKRRVAILEALLKHSTISYPAVLREYEIDDIEAQMKDDVARAGTTWDAYLAQIKKTPESFRESIRDAGDKRAKIRLLLSEIARKESIEADKERLAKEIERAHTRYPNADQEAVRAHITHALRNEAVIAMLEKLS